jgi:FkbM family methyltransferase
MLFSFYDLAQYLNPYTVKGVIHVGAHLCEETNYYYSLGIKNENIFWIEGNPETYELIKYRYPNFNIYNGLCTDKSGDKLTFNITKNKNNGNSSDSSSIFKLGTHLQHHPFVVEEKSIEVTSIRLDDLLANQQIQNVNMMNIDVQGAELLVLKGSEKILNQINYIYVEINREELYVGCALIEELDSYLKEKGFKRVLTKWTDFNWGDALYVKI